MRYTVTGGYYYWYDNGLQSGSTPPGVPNWVFIPDPADVEFDKSGKPILVIPRTSKNRPPSFEDFDLEREFDRLCSETQPHVHTWTEYVGFTERYSFCTTCDEKRE